MIVNTTRFGELEIESSEIISFNQGIPGFELHKNYVLLELEETPFAYLQSTDDEGLAFVVVDPFIFFKSYEFELPSTAIEELEITDHEDVIIRSIVTVKEKIEEATLNLVAPIVVNNKRKSGKQVILNNTKYGTRHSIHFPVVAEGGESNAGSV